MDFTTIVHGVTPGVVIEAALLQELACTMSVPECARVRLILEGALVKVKQVHHLWVQIFHKLIELR